MVDGPNVGFSAPVMRGIRTPSVKDRAPQDARRNPSHKKRPRPEKPRAEPPVSPSDGSIGTRLNVLA